MASGDQITPIVTDGSGYAVRERDLDFLGIRRPHFDRWFRRATILGLTTAETNELTESLRRALKSDGLIPEQCDLRLKGSAADFFSGHHKRFPFDRSDIVSAFREGRDRFPRDYEIDDIEEALAEVWSADAPRPLRRPFDSMRRLKISREPSDIDLQLSSDLAVELCVEAALETGVPLHEIRVVNPVYDFIERDLVVAALPSTSAACLRLTEVVLRHVNLAVFPRSGPRDTSAMSGELSAHFRESDWIVDLSESPDV